MDLIIPLKKNPVLKNVISFSRKSGCKVYLVGGFVRDLFLRKESLDLDFAVDKDAINFARYVAGKIGGNFIILDKEHGSARVIAGRREASFTLDFTDFRGEDITADLSKRDFTVNALALDILDIAGAQKLSDILIDPYSGISDIKAKIIRVINNKTFLEDPLRMLRAFSLSAVLGFSMAQSTVKLISRNKKGITNAASERIREELFKILATANSADFFIKMDKAGILSAIIPQVNLMRGVAQGPYHHLDVLNHSFEAMLQMDRLCEELKRRGKIMAYLKEIIACGHRRIAVLKLAAFLHDIGKPDALTYDAGKTKFHGHEYIGKKIAVKICDNLKLSLKEKEAIKTMIFWHLRPGYLADYPHISERAIFRYFRDTAEEGVSVLLLSISDQRATRGPLTHQESRIRHEKVCLWLAKEYFRRKEEKKLPRLITGNDLIKKLKLIPGPIFGRILEAVEEEQAAGEIATKAQALKLARRMAKC
ncbi:MAG: hypothetical protein COV72_01085 [Candidatus Omnitrophica bacterium CG11_big_fil_rev_8_21_14_0_20_42_13]|uniref:HD/PDEase domain-containing protein n=1 Tax=Candidatus Ghiorseimicrobium undicola TaxID=1974746 RepID=A0A2H0LZH1_9BACT|nr:MAG: hypothetical protein COV72_01085 [Candidatus Omnitrophica bacterium CG11_big_fil_rev_8_21_14_0_20_42_13]